MSAIDDAMEGLDENGLSALVACAVAVGSADYRFDPSESGMMVDLLEGLGFEREGVEGALDSVLESIGEMTPAEAVDWAAELVGDSAIGEACVTLAAAVATKTGGLAAKEGVVIQQIANAFGVGYPSDRYTELLGEGMQIGRS